MSATRCPRCKAFAYYVTARLTDCRRCGLVSHADSGYRSKVQPAPVDPNEEGR